MAETVKVVKARGAKGKRDSSEIVALLSVSNDWTISDNIGLGVWFHQRYGVGDYNSSLGGTSYYAVFAQDDDKLGDEQ